MAAELRLMTHAQTEEELDDRQLAQSVVQGDHSAFEQLVRRKTAKVYSLCYRLVGNSEDAKDVSQLVFVKLWENIGKYDAQFAFDTWLYRIVTNVGIDFIRSRQSREQAASSPLRLVKTSAAADQQLSIQKKEVETIFNEVSAVLSPKQKMIFAMREMQDIPSAEISRVLGCRESTVRNHLFNARKLMQQQLEKKFPEYAKLWRRGNEV